ncbi:Rv1733c family protein [Trujillonella humicola]|uniref:Rv1733c family protein n=1 Tax=Trujillonella humicola TaxID=3383699 RepID=UPI0039058F3F
MTPQPHVPLPRRRRFLPRGGPLERRCDRVEALSRAAAVVLVLLSLPVALAVGTVTAADLRDRAAEQTATRVQVPAVLTEDAEEDAGSAASRVPTDATWQGPDGAERRGAVPATVGARAGESVRIWVGPDGEVTRRPLSPGMATTEGVLAGVLVALLSATVVVSLHVAVCWELDRRRDRRWTAEWARVEPLWAGRAASGDA